MEGAGPFPPITLSFRTSRAYVYMYLCSKVRIMKCQNCEQKTNNPKFCSKRCAAIYNNKKFPKRNREKQYCVNCNLELNYNQKKFCSRTCDGAWKYKIVSIPQIEAGTSTNVTAIKRYLQETRGEYCSVCRCPPIHMAKKLTMQLDHIDGNSDNNNLINLRLICPNCHSQTETFCGRQKKDTRRNRYLRKIKGY